MQTQDKSVFSEGGHHLGKPGHSLALRYELLLKELTHMPRGTDSTIAGADGGGQSKKGGGVTHARINTCFQILDEVLPNLGVYQRVIKLLRDELYTAVYSHEFTSAKGSGGKKEPATQPLPYFVIAQKLMAKRGADMSKLKAEIASLKEQLYTCEADLEKASNSVEAYRHDVKERENKIHRLSSELRLCYSENERLQKVDNQHQRAQDRLKQEAEFRILALRNTVGSLKEDKTRLKVYKNTYDKLHDVFSTSQSKPHKQPPTVATDRTELEQHIASADLLRKQLLTMQNSMIQEYDAWMNSLALGSDQNTHILPAAVIQNKQNFQHSIAEISTELSLLQDHSICLSKRHVQVEELKKTSAHCALVLPAHPDNPLVPQQQVTSKYAIMVYSSSDSGQSYYSLKEAQLCYSCGNQTVVCPHKAMNSDMIVQLPVNSTHLKISRPTLTVTKPTASNAKTKIDKKNTESVSKPGSDIMSPNFTRLWTLFRAKYPQHCSTVPRALTADEVISLTQQLYAALLNQDDRAILGEDEQPTHLMECLFQFLGQRYQVEDIVPQVTFDYLSALSQHYSQSKELSVLCHMLSGQLDGCTFRYLLLLANLLDLLSWSSIKEVSPFLTVLYPFLQEEDIEQLTMNFIAHSSNRVSQQLLMDFFIWLLLRHREPLILMLEGKLMEHPCNKPGVMLEVEFAEAIEGLVPLVSDQLCRRLFLQSLVQYQEDNQSNRESLPIQRLAYIAGYLRTLSIAGSLKAELEQQAAINTSFTQPGTVTQAQGSASGHVLNTMESIRTIAGRIKAISLCN